MDNFELNSKPNYQEEDGLDIKGIIIKVISYWYFFVIGVVIALAIGFIQQIYTKSISGFFNLIHQRRQNDDRPYINDDRSYIQESQ